MEPWKKIMLKSASTTTTTTNCCFLLFRTFDSPDFPMFSDKREEIKKSPPVKIHRKKLLPTVAKWDELAAFRNKDKLNENDVVLNFMIFQTMSFGPSNSREAGSQRLLWHILRLLFSFQSFSSTVVFFLLCYTLRASAFVVRKYQVKHFQLLSQEVHLCK